MRKTDGVAGLIEEFSGGERSSLRRVHVTGMRFYEDVGRSVVSGVGIEWLEADGSGGCIRLQSEESIEEFIGTLQRALDAWRGK